MIVLIGNKIRRIQQLSCSLYYYKGLQLSEVPPSTYQSLAFLRNFEKVYNEIENEKNSILSVGHKGIVFYA